MALPLRIDPAQQFSCAQCGRCCRRWEIVVSQAEAEGLRTRDAGRWFRASEGAAEGAGGDPFMAIDGAPGFFRIRKRSDGACGFLSTGNRCRIHEELGGGRKPLTCRAFPFSFHPTPTSVIVMSSFGCPTVVTNEGERIARGTALNGIEALRDEWSSRHRPPAAAPLLVTGRSISARSVYVLRANLLQMINRADDGAIDLRMNVRRMALMLEDLTRVRVLRLPDADFEEYVSLTVPFAAADSKTVPARAPSRVGRLLQRGVLYAVAATCLRLENHGASRLRLRLMAARLLAHFHGLAPGIGRINLGHLRGGRIDINAPGIQPVIHHYVRASIESIDSGERPLIDTLALAVSLLNAACALAVMNARALNRPLDGQGFREALVEANDVAHIDPRGMPGRVLTRLAVGVEALYAFAAEP